jgi:hypothetical protein
MPGANVLSLIDQELTLTLEDAAGEDRIGAASPELLVSVSSELTQAHAVGDTVKTGIHGLAAIEADDGEPLTFFVDDQGRLTVIYGQGGDSPSGRAQQQILVGSGAVQAFAVSEGPSGTFILVAAVSSGPDGAGVSLYVTPPLASTGAVDWSGLEWVQRGGLAAGRVTRVLIGDEPDEADPNGEGPLIVIFTDEGGRAYHYMTSADISLTSAPWRALKLSEKLATIVDAAIGRGDEGPGVFVLGVAEAAQTLWFMPYDPLGSHSKLPIPAGGLSAARGALAVRGVAGRRTELYLAGEGIFMLPPEFQYSDADVDELRVVVPKERISGAHSLVVCEDDANVALWAVDRTARFHGVEGSKSSLADAGEPGEVRWGESLSFGTDRAQIAPMRNRRRQTDSLVTLSTTQQLEHWRISPEDKLWVKTEIVVDDETEMVTVDCYASVVTLARGDGTPFAAEPLQLRSADLAEAIINGTTYTLAPREPVPVTTDSSGALTIFTKVQGLAAPQLTLSGIGLSQDVIIDPTQKVWKRLDAVSRPEDLTGVRLEDGTPLVDEGVPRQNVDAIVQSVAKLSEIRRQLPMDGAASRTYLTAAAGAAELTSWRLTSTGSLLTYEEGSRAVAAMRESLLGVDVGRYVDRVDEDDALTRAALVSPGQLWEWFTHWANEAFEVLVHRLDDAWQVIVKIGEIATRFVIETLTHVHVAAERFLAQVAITFKKLQEWLGFLFAWKDIKVTNQVLTNVLDQVFAKGVGAISGLEPKIDGIFDDLISKARAVGGGVPKEGDTARDKVPKEVAASSKDLEQIAKSPQGSFLSYHLDNSVTARPNALSSGLPTTAGMSAEARGIIDDLLAQASSLSAQISQQVTAISRQVAGLASNPQLTANQLFAQLGTEALVAILNVTRSLVKAVLAASATVVQAVKDALFGPVEIPLLSALYRQYVGPNPSIMGGLLLAVSVPVTIGHKLLTGEAPFPYVSEQDLMAQEGDGAVAALSSDERYAGQDAKPRTYNLDTAIGDAFWALLAGGTVVLAVVAKLMGLAQMFTKVTELLEKAAPVMNVVKAAGRAVLVLAKGIWLAVTTKATGLYVLRWIRLGAGALGVIGAVWDVFDLTGASGAVWHVAGAVVEAIAVVPFAIIVIAGEVAAQAWVHVGISSFETLFAGVAVVSTLVGAAYAWAPPDPVVKPGLKTAATMLSALGVVGGMAVTAAPFAIASATTREPVV